MTTTTDLKCPNCGATTTKNGQPFKNGSALHTHMHVHCPKKSAGAAGTDKKCECKDGGKWRLLNNRHKYEAMAIEQGASEVCTVCLELV
jgi:hypothetical protein